MSSLKKVSPESPERKKLEVALVQVKTYKDQHNPIPFSDTISAIKS